MGSTDRLRQAIAGGRAEDQPHRSLNIAQMTRRNKDRTDFGTGAENSTDFEFWSLEFGIGGHLPQLRPIAFVRAWFLVPSAETALGAADCGDAQLDAQVAGYPAAARVGDPLTVADDYVGPYRKL